MKFIKYFSLSILALLYIQVVAQNSHPIFENVVVDTLYYHPDDSGVNIYKDFDSIVNSKRYENGTYAIMYENMVSLYSIFTILNGELYGDAYIFSYDMWTYTKRTYIKGSQSLKCAFFFRVDTVNYKYCINMYYTMTDNESDGWQYVFNENKEWTNKVLRDGDFHGFYSYTESYDTNAPKAYYLYESVAYLHLPIRVYVYKDKFSIYKFKNEDYLYFLE